MSCTDTRYSRLMAKADYYTREARRQYGKDNSKTTAFMLIAHDCRERARKMTIQEAGCSRGI